MIILYKPNKDLLCFALVPQFDTMTGTLTISGNATTEVYSQVIQQLTYLNKYVPMSFSCQTLIIAIPHCSFIITYRTAT